MKQRELAEKQLPSSLGVDRKFNDITNIAMIFKPQMCKAQEFCKSFVYSCLNFTLFSL